MSVFIPCRHAGHFIGEAVQSIVRQPHRYPFEVIVVDDASGDPTTVEALRQVKSQLCVTVIRLPTHRGAQYARSVGLRATKYDYAFTIDADDRLTSDPAILAVGTYADMSVDVLMSSMDVAFTQTFVLMFGDFNGLTISSYPLTEELVVKKHHAPISICFRRADALAAGLYDEAIEKWQDWSFAVALLDGRRAAGKQNQVVLLEGPHYQYRIHGVSGRTSLKDVSELEMVRRTVTRHPGVFRRYYPNVMNDDETAGLVMQAKPTQLQELLRVASRDLPAAMRMARERGFDLAGTNSPPSVP